MPPRARRMHSSTNGNVSAAGDAASAISIASAAHADRANPASAPSFRDSDDLHALELLEQELLQVQTLKSETQSQIELLLKEQKKLEILERREKAQSAKKASHSSRMSRIEQLQEQERVRHQQLQAARELEEQKRKARAEEARLKQANSIQTRDDEDLDDFLAHESLYF